MKILRERGEGGGKEIKMTRERGESYLQFSDRVSLSHLL